MDNIGAGAERKKAEKDIGKLKVRISEMESELSKTRTYTFKGKCQGYTMLTPCSFKAFITSLTVPQGFITNRTGSFSCSRTTSEEIVVSVRVI